MIALCNSQNVHKFILILTFKVIHHIPVKMQLHKTQLQH